MPAGRSACAEVGALAEPVDARRAAITAAGDGEDPVQAAEGGHAVPEHAQQHLDDDGAETDPRPLHALRDLREERHDKQDQRDQRHDDLAVDAVHHEAGHAGEGGRRVLQGGLVEHPTLADPLREAEDGEGDGRGLDDDLDGQQVGQYAIGGSHGAAP
jgi:hypothetical protein